MWHGAAAALVGAGVNGYLRLRKWEAIRAAQRKPGAFDALNPEFVWIESEGRKLACHFVRGRRGAGAWVLAHGLGENRWQMASRAQWLRARGASVLLFDFRAHGESDWGPCGFGAVEGADVEAAVRFLESEVPGEPIGFCGMSQGAAAGVLSEASPRMDRFILEGLYRRVEDAIVVRGEKWIPLIGPALARSYVRVTPTGEPIDAVRRLKQPKLFIAGALDPYVPIAQSRELAQAAQSPLIEFPNLKHQNFHRHEPERWEPAVAQFLRD